MKKLVIFSRTIKFQKSTRLKSLIKLTQKNLIFFKDKNHKIIKIQTNLNK